MTMCGKAAAAAALLIVTAAMTPIPATSAAPVQAKSKAAAPRRAPELSAVQVLERYLAATGGRAAYARITSMVTKGTVESQAQGLRGTFAATIKAPNKVLVVQTLPGIGESKQGFDGKIGWSQDPFTGLRTLGGPELIALKQASPLDIVANWRAQYKKIERIGTGKVGNRNAILIRLTPLVGNPATGYYDAQTFLLLRMDAVVQNPQGTFPMQAYFSDYRPSGGIKVPFVTRQRLGGILEIVLTITDIQHNVPVDDALFARPESPAAPAASQPSPPAPLPQAEEGSQ